MAAEEKVKLILEKRIEELNAQKQILHAKLIAYGANDEIKSIADEYRELQKRREILNADISKFWFIF